MRRQGKGMLEQYQKIGSANHAFSSLVQKISVASRCLKTFYLRRFLQNYQEGVFPILPSLFPRRDFLPVLG
jgi:hypothetical protein